MDAEDHLAALQEAVDDGADGDGAVILVGQDEARREYVTDQLRAFNLARSASLAVNNEPVPLEIYALDASGQVVAGLVAKTIWN